MYDSLPSFSIMCQCERKKTLQNSKDDYCNRKLSALVPYSFFYKKNIVMWKCFFFFCMANNNTFSVVVFFSFFLTIFLCMHDWEIQAFIARITQACFQEKNQKKYSLNSLSISENISCALMIFPNILYYFFVFFFYVFHNRQLLHL